MVYSADVARLPSFLEWLYPMFPPNVNPGSAASDLTKGQIFPYIKSKQIYICPADVGQYPLDPLFGPIDHSYQMPCMMCHAHDVSACIAPSQSVNFLEVTNQSRTFFSGIATLPTPPQMAFRHNQREHFLMVDTHVERLSRAEFTNAASDKRFWYPTDSTSRNGNP